MALQTVVILILVGVVIWDFVQWVAWRRVAKRSNAVLTTCESVLRELEQTRHEIRESADELILASKDRMKQLEKQLAAFSRRLE